MSSTGVEPKRNDVEVEALEEKNTLHSDVLVNKDLMSNAFEGENAEHQETVWEAIKSHKMACMWAFVSFNKQCCSAIPQVLRSSIAEVATFSQTLCR